MHARCLAHTSEPDPSLFTARRVVSDKDTGRPKGYAFCEYFDRATAESCVRNLGGVEVSGRSLRVDFAEDHSTGRTGPTERDRERDHHEGPPRGDRGGRFGGGVWYTMDGHACVHEARASIYIACKRSHTHVKDVHTCRDCASSVMPMLDLKLWHAFCPRFADGAPRGPYGPPAGLRVSILSAVLCEPAQS